MTVRVSRLYGMDIYDSDGGYVGKVNDLIFNLQEGNVVRVTTEPLRADLSREQLPEILQKKSFLYKRVKSVGDILIINKNG